MLISISQIAYASKIQSVFPTQGDAVQVFNNYTGYSDEVVLNTNYFKKGDLVKVYSTANTTDTTTIGAIQIDNSEQCNVIELVLPGQAAGTAFFTVTNSDPNYTESKRFSVKYKQEVSPTPENVTVYIQGNVDIPDTITFENLNIGDLGYVYSLDGKTKLGTTPIVTTQGAVTVKLSKHVDPVNPTFLVSVKCPNALESEKLKSDFYMAPDISFSPDLNQVVIFNNADSAPIVLFRNLPNKTVASVTYTNPKDGKIVTKTGNAIANIKKSSTADVAISLPVGTINQTGQGSISVSIKEYNKTPCKPIDIYYNETPRTVTPSGINVLGTENIIMVNGLMDGDTIKVYDSNNNVIGKAVVSKGTSHAIVNIKIKNNDYNVFITNKSKNMLESDKCYYQIYSFALQNNNAIAFSDNNFEYAVRYNITKASGSIYKSDIYNLGSFNGFYWDINNISGIENFTQIQYLYLDYNKITDISMLKDLKNLTDLDLSSNSITDITSLSSLTNLESLAISNNKISDITSLKNLKKLKKLNISGNNVSDKDIQDLKNALPGCEITY